MSEDLAVGRQRVNFAALSIGRSVGHGVAYRSDIDGLRSIAVGIVILFHAFPFKLSGGFIGVDVFFVISGFLITSLITKDLDAGNFSVLRFYQRRITRLFPALIAVLTASLVFAYLALFSVEFRAFGVHLMGGAAFVSNLVLMQEAGYFNEEAWLKPLEHLWSLGVEEQFYLVWPLFLMLVIGSGVSKRRMLTLGLIASIILASFAYSLYTVAHDSAKAYYSPLVRFWELMAGALLAVSGATLATIGKRFRLADIASIGGVALILAGAAVFIDPRTPFPGVFALFPVVGTCLIILAGPNAILNKYLLSNPVMVFVGLISYPLYLWHWPILSFLRIVESDEPSDLARILAVALAFALAAATYLWIERPIQKRRNKPATAIILLAIVLAFGLAGFGISAGKGLPERTTIARGEPVFDQFMGANWPYSLNSDCQSRHPAEGLSNNLWWFCVQSADKPATVMLVGSSHANHLYPGLIHNPALSQQVVLNIGTCEPAWVSESFVRTGLVADEPCAGARQRKQQELIDSIAAEGHVKYVILAGMNPSGTHYESGDYTDNLLHRINAFEAQGIRVIVFAPQLEWTSNVKRCFPRPFRNYVETQACTIAPEAREAARSSFAPVAKTLRERDPAILIFDPNDVFCQDGPCSVTHNGLPLYRDKYEHLSTFGSNEVAALFVTWAKTNLPDILNADTQTSSLAH